MNDAIKEILEKDHDRANGDKSWYEPLTEPQHYIEHLRYGGTKVKEMDRDSHRWWDEYTVIKKFKYDGEVHFIGYRNAHSTRDMSAEESGWEFNEDTVALYEPKEVVTIEYVKLWNDE